MLRHQAASTGVVILAIALQITATLGIGASPLRTSAADLLLPIALAAVAVHLFLTAPPSHRVSGALAKLTAWRLPWPVLAALAGATSGVLVLAVFVGKATTGSFSQWAVVNKLGGWGVLLGFAVLGYLIAHGSRSLLFLRAFMVFAMIVAGMTYLAHILQTLGFSTAPYFISNDTRVGGLMSNPTAFGFLAAVLVVIQLADMRDQHILPRHWHIVGVALGLVLTLLSGSRSTWIGLVFGITTLALLRRLDFRTAVIAAIAAIPLVIVAFTSRDVADNIAPDPGRKAMVYVLDIDLLSSGHVSVYSRVDQLNRSLELWRSSPWLGIGLGSYIRDDAARGHNPPQHIHNSALWLLTETGIVGATVFGALFVVLAWGLWPGTGAPPFAAAAFAVLMVFAGVSIGTEALYQRHLWVIMGMALATSNAVPRSLSPHSSNQPQESAARDPAP